MQKPLDLSMSIFRQCCAEARLAASRNVTANQHLRRRHFAHGRLGKCYAAVSGFVRAQTNQSAAATVIRIGSFVLLRTQCFQNADGLNQRDNPPSFGCARIIMRI